MNVHGRERITSDVEIKMLAFAFQRIDCLFVRYQHLRAFFFIFGKTSPCLDLSAPFVLLRYFRVGEKEKLYI
jgi:hypothetical protein